MRAYLDEFSEGIYANELLNKCKRALAAIDRFNSILQLPDYRAEDLFFALDDFLNQASAAASILFPTQGDRRRGQHMRERLNVADDDCLRDRALRNHLVHFDERLDRWRERSKDRIYIDQNIGGRNDINVNGGRPLYMRHYLIAEKIYIFMDHEYQIDPMVQSVSNLLNTLQRTFPNLRRGE